MLRVEMSSALEQRLHELAAEAGQSADEFALTAIKQFMEDREDYLEAVEAVKEMEENGGKTYSLEEVSRELGLDD